MIAAQTLFVQAGLLQSQLLGQLGRVRFEVVDDVAQRHRLVDPVLPLTGLRVSAEAQMVEGDHLPLGIEDRRPGCTMFEADAELPHVPTQD